MIPGYKKKQIAFISVFISLVLNISAATQNKADYKKSLTETDKAELVAQLFRNIFFPIDDGLEIKVLFSPRVEMKLLPQITGYTFAQLSYEEEKTAKDYYEVGFDIHKQYVAIKILRGSYCRKEGDEYTFRKVNRKSDI